MTALSKISTEIEDILPYAIPVVVALAGFNWSSLIPGDNNAILTGVAFGFLAKFLIGIQTNGLSSWEDWIPTLTISLGFLATSLSANPQYLAYGTIVGFVVKALGYFSDTSHPVEDLMLAVGAFLMLYGQYTNNQELVGAGSLLALVGKTAPSLGTSAPMPAMAKKAPALPPTPSPAPAPPTAMYSGLAPEMTQIPGTNFVAANLGQSGQPPLYIQVVPQ